MARGLVPQLIQLPFAAGLNQKADARAKQPPYLDICKDAQFDEIGGLQTRYPYAALGTNILGGGVITNPRRLVANGDELLLFTDVALYSWSVRDTAWVLKATHLAIKTGEETRFAQTMDQVGCDRAELGGVVFFAWTGTNNASSAVYIAAIDKATGNVILPPTAAETNVAGTSPRLLALDTKVLLVWYRTLSEELVGIALEPNGIGASIAAPTVIIPADHILPYDLAKVHGVDSAVLVAATSVTTSYKAITVTSAMVVTTVNKARTCDGPIAVAPDTTGTFVEVVRAAGGNIVGDRLNVALADTGSNNVAIGTAIGTIDHLTAAFRSVADGAFYRCYCFWSASESAGPGVNWTSKSNWVDTNGAHGVEANFVRLLAPASRAFDHAGRIYVWGAFAGATTTSGTGYVEQLQNTYFLYRDDASLVSKACFDIAGGLPATSMLPGVQDLGGGTFAWCGTMRRAVPVGTNVASLGYAERAPRDITFAFDSNEARRCVRLGRTLYIAAGGEILQYDGTSQLVEVGFHVYPWAIGVAIAGAGAITDGTYAFKATWKWPNAVGEVDRSTTAAVATVQMAGGPLGFDVVVNPLYTTRKIANPPGLEVWRTAVNPTADSPFKLASSNDPSVLAGSNNYIANDPTVFPLPTMHDALSDAALSIRQADPEEGAVLESLAPPGATLICANDTRIFLAGIPGAPNTIWYSKQRGDDEVAAFNDALIVELPAIGGDITAIAFMSETLVVFKETAVYALPGDGFDNTGGGQNFGPPRLVSNDLGAVNAEGVVLTDKGLVFKSAKGWALLDRSLSVTDMGTPVANYNDEVPLAVHVVKDRRQIRCLSSSRMLVFDYQVGQWSEWTIGDGLDATLWQGRYVYLAATGAKQEQQSFAGLTYGWDIEMTWIKPADLQGAARIWWLMVLGEWRSAFHLRIRLARDYQSDGAGGALYFEDKYWTPTPATLGGPLQVRIGPSIQQVEAIKIRLTAVDANNHANPPTGEAAKLTGLGLEVGLDPGLFKRLPAAQKA